MKKGLSLLLSLGFYAGGNSLLSSSVNAQVTPDGTTNTTVNSNNNNFTIENGDRAGANLFHSFRDFSVPNGGSAVFNNAAEIENIFSRVTGGNISNINGLIQANDANLFLVNPAGILFGREARLDIGGSFLGTTADSILFEDGEFSATDFDNSPLLTVNAPIGLNFRDNPGDIINRSGFEELNNGETIETEGLRVDPGKFLTLVGNNINLDNGRLTAPGGRIELAGITASGTIQLNEDLSLSLAEDLTRGDVSLNGFAEIDVTFSSGGDINIYGQNINVLGGSDICAGIGADGACGERNNNFGFANARSGDIFLDATDTLTIDGGISDVNNQVNLASLGNSGDINIQVGSLVISNGGRVSANTSGEGNSGKISIFARERVSISDSEENPFSTIRSNINTDGIGNSGGIDINTNSLFVNDGAQIQSFVAGIGDSGKIIINADSVEFSGRDVEDFPSGAFSLVESGGQGNAGGININAKTFLMSDRAQLLSNTDGIGNGGDINLQITNESSILNSSILTEVTAQTEETAGGFGNGGDINITANFLLLQNGSSLLADTENEGNAGNVNIDTNNLILKGEGLSSRIGAMESEIIPSQISTTVEPQAIGDGGNITISSSSVSIRENAFISATSLGEGKAGVIDIQANDIQLKDGVEVTAETRSGEGGNIFLTASNNVTLEENSLISAQAFGNSDGGNLTIDANFVIAFPDGNNDIVANAQQGQGGIITINAESLLGIQERPLNDSTNDINASSEASDLDGDVVINTSDINPVQGATELPSNLVVPEQTVAQACANREINQTNSFVVKGKGGVPALPTASFSSEVITINGKPVNNSSNSGYAIPTSQGNIIPARGIVKTAGGQVILTAAPVANSTTRIPNNSINCG